MDRRQEDRRLGSEDIESNIRRRVMASSSTDATAAAAAAAAVDAGILFVMCEYRLRRAKKTVQLATDDNATAADVLF